MRSPFVVIALTALSSLALAGCASADAENAGANGDDSAPLTVMASFYPLQYIAEEVGGDLVDVESLTPPATEPHDVELSPATVASLEKAGIVVYLAGFQPAVDDAIRQAASKNVVDVSAEATLEGHHSDEAEEAGDGHAAEEEHPARDLHFWLDPERLAKAAETVAAKLGEADPGNARVYQDNARTLTAKLTALDKDFTQGLATCRTRTVVVSHEAYGYLTEKYNLKQVGISGVEPDTEPSPARLADIGKVVRNEGVTTVFTETLVNPKVAETLAADLGVSTAVLDPVEGLVDDASDYDKVMRDNLDALQTALGCS